MNQTAANRTADICARLDRKAHTCKHHNHAHSYVKHSCGHEYCPFYWKACPRCHGSDSSNMTDAESSDRKPSAPVLRPKFGISHAAMILREAIDSPSQLPTTDGAIAAHAAIATLAALFNGDMKQPRYEGMSPREIYETEYRERNGSME